MFTRYFIHKTRKREHECWGAAGHYLYVFFSAVGILAALAVLWMGDKKTFPMSDGWEIFLRWMVAVGIIVAAVVLFIDVVTAKQH